MANPESQQFRDNLAKEVRSRPKEDRKAFLEEEKKKPEYQEAQAEKLNERLNAVPVDEAPEEIVARKQPLSEWEAEKARKLIEQGKPEEFIHLLKGNGLPASTQAEMAMHYMKDYKEGIRLISWTKKRLAYTAAILEHTVLKDTNNSVTSAENIIQNYLIFCRIFEESEGKIPRFGQFAYVIRDIFSGVTSRTEIDDRIANHRTFGERVVIDPSEIDALAGEIGEISADIDEKYKASQEKKKKLDEALANASNEEKQEKGKVWNTVYSEPKEYTFPNYTFQTGPRKGMKHSIGRSSWEPMLEAYADVVNKRMADRISAKSTLSETEKTKRIQEQRIELLYEKFQFPVDIRINKNGEEEPVIYILDFIDINRWRAIEVKGPLTPKGAEKIRLFQKYYVDGDFSDLSEEKRMIMMRYVEDKKDEVKEYCKEMGYPVFDHFSSLEVLGAYKWDHDLNNFNRYEDARYMKELPVRTRQQLQKGFFKLVEDRIKAGKTPDIRPDKYTDTDKLPGVIKINQKEARSEKTPYEIEKPASTKPYIPAIVAGDVIANYKELLARGLGHTIIGIEEHAVLNTIPLSREEQDVFLALTGIFNFHMMSGNMFRDVLGQLSVDEIAQINSGERFGVTAVLPNTLRTSDYAITLKRISIFRNYLLTLKGPVDEAIPEKYKPAVVMKFLDLLVDVYKESFAKSPGNFKVNRGLFEKMREITSAQDMTLDGAISYYEQLLLGKYSLLYERRSHEISALAYKDISQILGTEYSAQLRKSIESRMEAPRNNVIFNDQELSIINLIMSQLIAEKAMPPELICCFDLVRDFTYRRVYDLYYFINRHFENFEKASQHFASRPDSKYSKKEYLEVLGYVRAHPHSTVLLSVTQGQVKEYMMGYKEMFLFMADVLLKDELGEEGYRRLNDKFNEKYLQYTQKQVA